MNKLKRTFFSPFGIIILIILFIIGGFMIKQKNTKDEYIEAVKETQELVSNYIVENFEGIKTI